MGKNSPQYLWAGLYFRAIKSQQSRLTNFQGTKAPHVMAFFLSFLSLRSDNPINHLEPKRLSRTVARLLKIVDLVIGKNSLQRL